jgi:hypothetical protein
MRLKTPNERVAVERRGRAGESRSIWINKGRQELCNQKMPIVITENNSAWLPWWVSLPRVGRILYSYFSSTIVIEEKDRIE